MPPNTRPPRQWRPHDRAHQRIIAARDISADTSRPGGGVGEGEATAWHCSGPRGLWVLALPPPPRRRRPFLVRLPPGPPHHGGRRATLQAGRVGRTPLHEPGLPRLPKGAVPLAHRFYAPLASPKWPPIPARPARSPPPVSLFLVKALLVWDRHACHTPRPEMSQELCKPSICVWTPAGSGGQ